MSIVAWDGRMIAADKQGTCAGLRFTTTKLKRIASGEVLAITGDQDSGGMVMRWYESGADPAAWPKSQEHATDWSRLIVASASGVKVFERQPVSVPVEDAFMAWGSGRDYALGAMERGASAEEAVIIATKFDTGCGCGRDSFRLSDAADEGGKDGK